MNKEQIERYVVEKLEDLYGRNNVVAKVYKDDPFNYIMITGMDKGFGSLDIITMYHILNDVGYKIQAWVVKWDKNGLIFTIVATN